MTITEFPCNGVTYELHPPLSLQVQQDDEGLYCLHESLNLWVFADDAAALKAQVIATLCFFFKEYVVSGERMTPQAVQLRQRLLQRCRLKV